MNSAPGRAAADEMLRHDVTRQTELLILLLLLRSLLSGIVIARAVGARRPALLWISGTLGSVLPLTWYLTGFVVQFGFFNVALAVAVLLAVWLICRGIRRRRSPCCVSLTPCAPDEAAERGSAAG